MQCDGDLFAVGCRFFLSGKDSVGLFPSMFTLSCWNLREQDYLRLCNAGELAVYRGDSCLAFGKISDVFRRTVPEGAVTTAAFSLGLDLWETPVSLAVEAGVPVSETVRRILFASGTGIQLLSFPGGDPPSSRARAFCGRAAECISEALSAASARGCLVPAGLRVIPKDPLPAAVHLAGKDLADRPAFADGGRKMILSAAVAGFRPGEWMTLSLEGRTASGLVLERFVEADTGSGPWSTQLLVTLSQAPRR